MLKISFVLFMVAFTTGCAARQTIKTVTPATTANVEETAMVKKRIIIVEVRDHNNEVAYTKIFDKPTTVTYDVCPADPYTGEKMHTKMCLMWSSDNGEEITGMRDDWFPPIFTTSSTTIIGPEQSICD